MHHRADFIHNLSPYTTAVFPRDALLRDTTFQSSAYGKRENVETSIDGRVMFDMLPYMFRNHKLSSYSLNSVSAELLGQQKEDVHYSIISDLQVCGLCIDGLYALPSGFFTASSNACWSLVILRAGRM